MNVTFSTEATSIGWKDSYTPEEEQIFTDIFKQLELLPFSPNGKQKFSGVLKLPLPNPPASLKVISLFSNLWEEAARFPEWEEHLKTFQQAWNPVDYLKVDQWIDDQNLRVFGNVIRHARGHNQAVSGTGNEVWRRAESHRLNKIERLMITEVPMTRLPPEISKISNLTHLILWGLYVEVLPDEVCQLGNLQKLKLNYLCLRDLPPDLSSLTLKKFEFDGNNFHVKNPFLNK